jgi:membrane protease YdiL (CAAX protease family)
MIVGVLIAALWLSASSLAFSLVPPSANVAIIGAILALIGASSTGWYLAKTDWDPPTPTKTELEYLPWAIITGIALQFICMPLVRSGFASIDAGVLATMVITMGIMLPAAEEVFFRYFLWKKLPAPEVTTTILFALAHLPSWGWNRAVLLLIPGILFAFWRNRSGGIFPGIGCHVAFNVTGLLLT